MSNFAERIAALSPEQRRLLEARLTRQGIDLNRKRPIPRRDDPTSAPLSFAQQRLWFLDQLEPGCAAYNVQLGLRLDGELDIAALEDSLNRIVQRHEVLRTHFAEVGGEPVQVVSEHARVDLPVTDLSGTPPPEREQEARRLAVEESLRPFDLSSGPLLRASLLLLGSREYVLLLTIHHIAADGWSVEVFLRELTLFYEARLGNFQPPLTDLPIQYADFAAWQREQLKGDGLREQLDYWRRQLGGADSALALPTDRPRPAVSSHRGASESFSLPRRLSDAAAALSRQEGVTLFMTLLAAWVALLHHYTGQEDISVGTPVAIRDRAELEGLIGFFANTLVLRTRLEGHMTFRQLLTHVRDVAVGAFAHQDTPFEQVVEALQPERSLSHSPLFQVMFVLHNTPHDAVRLPGLSVRPLGGGATARFDLTFSLRETEQGLSGSLEYSTDLFDAETIRRLAGHFRTLLEDAVYRPEQRIDALSLLTRDERHQLSAWNRTGQAFDAGATLHGLVSEQAARTPEAVAVTCGDERLSYRELEEQAGRLASRLRRLGVGPEAVVGVSLERSTAMVSALLGVLKAGGAYLPLDPGYPDERLTFMLKDSGAAVLLTDEAQGHRFREAEVSVICVDSVEEIDVTSAGRASDAGPDNAAYVIYTSGSTGRPKGVVITHRGICNRLLWTQLANQLGPSDRVLQKTPFTFDVSVWEFFWPLMTGARLVVARPGGHQDSAYLADLIARERVTTIHFVPSMLRVFLEEDGLERCASLGRVICSGEALPFELQERYHARLDAPLFNLYGPTEASVDVTHWECERDGERRVVPIGRPIANTQIHILHRQLRPLPVGVPGELHIGGVGLARGYVNRPGLTAERFVPDPFSEEPGGRLYKTGDVARRLAGGEIEYLGRLDHQVKLRGFRIELAEVESVLLSHAGLKEAAVAVQGNPSGDQRLVAYVVAKEGGRPPELDELRELAKSRLPEYMVPSAFVRLDGLPLTTSGKVDRRALAGLNVPRQGPAGSFVPPRTEVERLLAGVWAEMLGVERVGLHDNFFELGGHSLLATQVMSRLRKALRVELPLRSLFDAPTLAGLAAQAEAKLNSAGSPSATTAIKRASRERELPLSFAQQRLWFMHLLAPGSAAYNIATALRLSGRLDLPALESSLSEIARRHETLRTTFHQADGWPTQVISPPGAVELPLLDLSAHGVEERETEVRLVSREAARQPFDLSEGPLWRVRLFRLQPEEHVLLLTMHHIVTDGWSFGVFARELAALYQAFSRGEPSPLPELAVQYADFAVWQREWLRGEVFDRQLDYWLRQLEGAPPLLKLPLDRPRPPAPSFRGAQVKFQLTAELTLSLQKLSRRAGVTHFMTLLAAFEVLLYRYTRQEDMVVGADMANRNREETEGLIGFFVNMLVLRTDLSGDPTFLELLARVREVTLGAYAHQDLPFGTLVEELQTPRETNHNPLFQVVFVLQNAPAEELRAPGLTVTPLPVETEAVPFDIVLGMWEGREGLAGTLSYSTDLFERATAERFVEHLRTLLAAVAAEPGRRLSDFRLLAEEDVQQLSPERFGRLKLSRQELEGVILELGRTKQE